MSECKKTTKQNDPMDVNALSKGPRKSKKGKSKDKGEGWSETSEHDTRICIQDFGDIERKKLAQN